MDEIKQLLKQSDDFTHKENVKVYRNVQAVVVDEVKKQTEAIAAQNDELVRRNEHLQKQGRGLRPLMIITLVTALANIVLAAAQVQGCFNGPRKLAAGQYALPASGGHGFGCGQRRKAEYFHRCMDRYGLFQSADGVYFGAPGKIFLSLY